jgi:hypothetical protein
VTEGATATTSEAPRSVAMATERRRPPLLAALERRRWRSRTTMSCHLNGVSGRACPHQPPSPRRGRS